MDRILRLEAGANVGHADQDVPFARRYGSRQAGRGGIHKADGEGGFVAAAPAAKLRRIKQAEIERRVLLFAGVGEGDGHALSAWRDGKRHFHIALILRAAHRAFESDSGEIRPRNLRSSLCVCADEMPDERERREQRTQAPLLALRYRFPDHECHFRVRFLRSRKPRRLGENLAAMIARRGSPFRILPEENTRIRRERLCRDAGWSEPCSMQQLSTSRRPS